MSTLAVSGAVTMRDFGDKGSVMIYEKEKGMTSYVQQNIPNPNNYIHSFPNKASKANILVGQGRQLKLDINL